ncbi:MAG: rhodanese-like domain-containing protein [Gammaproteobacteria bacterium]|nr:rhodanese-like domain-containing protein [Gammaproteobacteria bacterium]
MSVTAAQFEDVTREELRAQLDGSAPPLVLDVRTPEEYAAGHVPGALNLPHDQAAARLEELRSYQGRTIVLYCKSGRRAGIAADALAQAGFGPLHHLAGDMPGWIAAGLPIEKTSPDTAR